MIAVIILNWNGTDDTLACLESVTSQSCPRRILPIVVDNGSDLSCKERVISQFPETTVIESPVNLGFSGGCNLGAKHAISLGAELLLFLNNDAVISRGSLEKLCNYMDERPGIGVLNPLMLHQPANTVRVESGTLRITWWRGRTEHEGSLDPTDFRGGDSLPSDFGHGGALLTRADIFEKVGGFDRSLFAYDEDVDYGLKVRKLGYDCACLPTATVFHQVNGSTKRAAQGSLDNPAVAYLPTRNRVITVRRHAPFWQRITYLGCCLWIQEARNLAANVYHRQFRSARARIHGIFDGFRYAGDPPSDWVLNWLGLCR